MKSSQILTLGVVIAMSGFFNSTPLQAQILLNFETAGEFTSSFQKMNTAATDSRSLFTQSSNGAANDYIRHDNATGSGTNAGAVYMYDTVPGTAAADSYFSTASPLTVNLDFRLTTTNSSIGIYFADPSNLNNNVLVLFNVVSGSPETFRVFRDGTPTSVAAGTQVSSTQNFATTAPLNGGSGAFTALSFTLSVSGTTPTLSSTLGSETLSQVFSAGDFNFSGDNTAVILRVFDAGTGANTPVDIDNFAVNASPVPEPSTCVLLTAVGAVLTFPRRRNKFQFR